MILISFTAISVLVIIDQLIKLYAKNNLLNVNNVVVIENIFRLRYVENTGAAFGILSEHRWVFISLTIIFLIIGIYFIITKKLTNKFYQSAVVFLVAGGIGNIIDRIFAGYVVDMFDLYFINFAIFNFADICVTVGCILLIIATFFSKEAVKPEKEAAKPEKEELNHEKVNEIDSDN